MASQINLQPQTLDLALYAGDGAKFKVICTDPANAPIDVTGTVDAQIRLDRLTETDPIVEFTVNNTDAYLGIIVLSLTGIQTRELSAHPSSSGGKFTGVWDMQWTPADDEPRTLCQGKVECVSDVTR